MIYDLTEFQTAQTSVISVRSGVEFRIKNYCEILNFHARLSQSLSSVDSRIRSGSHAIKSCRATPAACRYTETLCS